MPPEIIAVTRQIRTLWHRFDWLPEWAVIGLVLLVFVGGGWLTHKIAFAILRRVVRNKDLFWRGVVDGISTRPRTPWVRHANAKPWAWFPALAHTTPAARASSSSWLMRLNAPRSL